MRDYGKKSQTCKSRLNFRVRDQFEIKIFKVRLMNTTYFICRGRWQRGLERSLHDRPS